MMAVPYTVTTTSRVNGCKLTRPGMWSELEFIIHEIDVSGYKNNIIVHNYLMACLIRPINILQKNDSWKTAYGWLIDGYDRAKKGVKTTIIIEIIFEKVFWTFQKDSRPR